MRKTQYATYARRLLPPLSSLSAFESAARNSSFTRAAEELSLTPGAVSRQITALEQLLGLRLFERTNNQSILTPAGQLYYESVVAGLTGLRAATAEVIASKGRGGVLRLGVLPTFGSRWLIPRIERFLELHRDLTVAFTTRLPGPFDFQREKLDAAIHFGDAVWPGAILEPLMGEELTLVASPALVKRQKFRAPSDLLRAVLLVHASQDRAWTEYFERHRLRRNNMQQTVKFEMFAMILQAAVSGLGVALVPSMLAQQELSSCQLIPLFDTRIKISHVYHFVYPQEKRDFYPVTAFREWLLSEVRTAIT